MHEDVIKPALAAGRRYKRKIFYGLSEEVEKSRSLLKSLITAAELLVLLYDDILDKSWVSRDMKIEWMIEGAPTD